MVDALRQWFEDPVHRLVAMIGALTRIVSAICRKSCTCCTSFVFRVMSDAVPKRFISRAEKR